MAYGKIKADTFVYDNSGSDVEVTLSSLGNKANSASPTFTGTVTIPTPAANDNTTKAASTAYVQTELGDYLTTATATSTYAPKASPTFTGTVNAAALTLSGNLTVNGTTTTIDSTTLNVEDKNIELGKVSTPTDTTADGGGITLKGATDKTFNWVNSSDAWKSSEHIWVTDGKRVYFGDGADLAIFHSGSDSWIYDDGAGPLVLGTNNSNIEIRGGGSGGDTMAKFKSTEGVELYFNNSKKAESTTDGFTVTGTVSDSLGNVRSIPLNAKTASYTAVATDAGKAIHTTHGVTVNNSVFSEADALTVINNSGSDITITQGSGLTMHNSADAATGNRTLAGRGMATIYFAAANTAYISGAGLS